MSDAGLCPALLPPLPSNTNGPAWFVGVMGPSVANASPPPEGEPSGVISSSRGCVWIGVMGVG